jgi:hypothetical protein
MTGSLVDWHAWAQKVFSWTVQVDKGMTTDLNFQITAEALPRQLVTLHIVSKCCQKSGTVPLLCVGGSSVTSSGQGKTRAFLGIVSIINDATPCHSGSQGINKFTECTFVAIRKSTYNQ